MSSEWLTFSDRNRRQSILFSNLLLRLRANIRSMFGSNGERTDISHDSGSKYCLERFTVTNWIQFQTALIIIQFYSTITFYRLLTFNRRKLREGYFSLSERSEIIFLEFIEHCDFALDVS